VSTSSRRAGSVRGLALSIALGVVLGLGTTTVAVAAPVAADATSSPTLDRQDASSDHEMGASGGTRGGADESLSRTAAVSPPRGVPGFDVSSYQPSPDFAAARSAGARFTFVKASEGVPGTYTNGNPTGSTNRYRSAQFAGAQAAGLTAGFYHYALPFYSSGAPQAQFFLDNATAWKPGMLPPVLDVEVSTNPTKQGGRCWGLSQSEMVTWIQSWIGTVVAQQGVQPIIYTNQDFWSSCTGNSTAFPKDRLFVAYYPTATTNTPVTPPTSSFATWTFWQWSQTENSPYPGDQDVFNGTEAQLAALTRPTTPAVGRLSGADAFATAATIAASAFTPPVVVDGDAPTKASIPLVYVASRSTYPDALAGGAAAGYRGAPVLLTYPDTLPDATRAQLAELRPQRVVVLGGVAAVSDTVRQQLSQIATAGAAGVTRVSGADRFDTSATISSTTFPPGRGGTAYVATGLDFPDALSGAALAGGPDKGPMLLTRPDALPQTVSAELARLAPARIVVLGGVNAVGESVVAQLKVIAPTSRLSGADRFDTSAVIAAAGYPSGSDVAFVATGVNFPDALAGAPTAGRLGGPVLLTRPDGLPVSVRTALTKLGADGLVVLGGPNAVSPAVEAGL
jgi:putative cell wall-binding protein/GH25 family lysozyme M1 (1,4-beta-N-acetylmuramidase)